MRRISSRKLGGLAILLSALGTLGAAACSSGDAGSGGAAESLGTARQALNSVSYVSGKDWYVDGNKWLMKGVNWDPSEPCEWYTQYNWGRAAGDAAIMQANGFNTIRTYGFVSAKAGLPENGQITTAQLDEFKNRGIRVILAVHSAPGDSTWTGTTKTGNNVNPATGDFTQAAKDRITLLANHPAVIALGVGNEIDWNYFYTKDPGGAWSNGWTIQNVVAHANYVTNKVKLLTDKPVTVSWGNTAHIAEVANLNADIISYQIYHQLQLDNVFNLHANTSSKPFYISEFGADAWNQGVNGEDQVAQKVGNNTLFKMILDQATTGAGGNVNHKVIGGTIFSFSDGWWKGGKECTHESGGIAPGDGPYPDLTFNEEYWGLCTGDGAVTRTCRQTMGDLKTLFSQYSSVTQPPPPAARNLANNLEAESNDGQNGVQFETTTDTGGGQNAGWINPGSWIEWNVNVTTAGSYTVTSRSATMANATYDIYLDGTKVGNNTTGNTNGWQTWASYKSNQFNMPTGQHRIRITFTSANQNLNYIKVDAVAGNGGNALSGTIEAESYSSMSGIGTENSTEGGRNVMDIGNGEWIAFNNVALTGVTSFDVRVAGQTYAGTIEFRTGSATGTLLATCNAPITGGWQNWTTVNCTATGATGNQTLYLVSKGVPSGSQLPNINWFKPIVGNTGSGGNNGGGTGAQPTRLRITNQCAEPIWIAHAESASTPIPDAQNLKIAPGSSYDYQIPAGKVEATRFMPRTGCDANGLNCKIGQSVAPCPTGGCQPPVETKFEATFGTTTPTAQCPTATTALGECVTWYNASFVDGYTLPVKVIPKMNTPYADCQIQDASNLRLDNCPSSERINGGTYSNVDLRIKDPADSTKIIGCLSPCKRMNYSAPWGFGQSEGSDPTAHMCCPTPYPNNTPLACTWANGCGTSAMCNDMGDPNTVVHTNYVNRLQEMAPNVYSFAYDDADSLRTCYAETKFEVVYCPGGSPSYGTTTGSNAGTCSDGIKNQTEAGVDCGGPCNACATCSDGIKNQNEIGVDCGGLCPACANCSDGVQNQGETGVDCGGPCAACGSGNTTQIEAETFSATGGVGTETCTEGGSNLKDVGDGEWVSYNNVNLTGVTQFQARVASSYLTGTIEFRTDSQNGTLLATCNAPVTSGWQNWTTVSCTATGASGTKNLYLVFHGSHANSDLPNVNWIKLVKGGSCTPTTCAAQGKTCGGISDGCSATLNCGTCGSGYSCGSSNTCVANCTPTTCAAQGKNCGSISNGCGGTLSCGTCAQGYTCGSNSTCQASGGSCAPSLSGYTAGKCDGTAVYNGKMYKCISQASGVNGSTACGTAGVYCSNITPTDAAWGTTAWQFIQNCP